MTPPIESELTWTDMLVGFEFSQRAQGHSERTISNYRYMLERLEKLSGHGPGEITLTDLRTMLNRPIAPASKQVYRACYQVFFRWMYREGYIPEDPSVRLDKVRVPRTSPRPVTPEEVQSLLESGAYRKTRTMILLGALQGMRVAEIARMRGEMVDLVDNRLRYIAKGGVEKDDELHPLIRAEAWKYPRTGFWFPTAEGTKRGNESGHIRGDSVSDLISRAMQRAGIKAKHLTAHSLRHHFGTELVEAGVDIRVIQQMMGHKNLSTTAIYTQVSRRKTYDAINKLPSFDVPSKADRTQRVYMTPEKQT